MRRRRFEVLLASVLWLAFTVVPALAQSGKAIQPDLGRLAGASGGQVFNRTVTVQREGDRTVVRLNANASDGGVLVDDLLLSEGVIELDLRGKNETQRSFVGIAFHLVDWTTYDAIYFRPFNFRAAGEEQRAHSVQYVSAPSNSWQKLRAERPGQFEKALDPAPDPDAWFHVRIVIANSRVQVYVNGATTPCLSVDDLGEAKTGGIALWAGNGSDGAYANLSVTQTAPPGRPPESRQTVFEATATGNMARLRSLVEADGQAVRQRMPDGLVPLHVAAAYDQRQAAEYLISKGADVNAIARHSGTPVDVAYESQNRAFARWLESKGGTATPIRFDVTPLKPALHRLAFPWGMMNNVLVFSGTDGAVLVDSGFSTRALDELGRAILRLSPAGVRYVINTHAHADHVAGNGLAPGGPASIINAAMLASPPPGLAITRQAEPLKGRTGRTLPAGYTWRAGGADIVLIPRPGLHSAADLIVYFPDQAVVAMGDLLLAESAPAVPDVVAYLAFLDDVLDVFPASTTFVSGHGRDLDAGGVRAYRDALASMIGIVRANLAAGQSAEQMVKDDVLKDYKAKYGLLDFLSVDTLIPRAVTALQKGAMK